MPQLRSEVCDLTLKIILQRKINLQGVLSSLVFDYFAYCFKKHAFCFDCDVMCKIIIYQNILLALGRIYLHAVMGWLLNFQVTENE